MTLGAAGRRTRVRERRRAIREVAVKERRT
jgi:hypothetical protein